MSKKIHSDFSPRGRMKLPHNFYRGRAITMDCHHCITESAERKKGQHLRMEDRGAIKILKKQGLGPRAIARQIGCAPSTVTNELRRGTPARKSNKGKAPDYSPKLGDALYRANRASCQGIRKRASAATLPVGWFGRSGNTSGPWMPAVAMPSDTACSGRLRWSAPVPFTTWSGKGTSPSSQWNCPRR